MDLVAVLVEHYLIVLFRVGSAIGVDLRFWLWATATTAAAATANSHLSRFARFFHACLGILESFVAFGFLTLGGCFLSGGLFSSGLFGLRFCGWFLGSGGFSFAASFGWCRSFFVLIGYSLEATCVTAELT